MSTTSTYLRLEEMNKKKHTVFHHEIVVEDKPHASLTTYPKESTQHLKEAKQNVLLLNGVREQYSLVTGYSIPSILYEGEILVKVLTIGLNPIDWKSPAFNFGIPGLPWIFGRDLAGVVVKVSNKCSRLRAGDIVLVPSTDYRDIRKAAFQEYAVTTYFNAARIPSTTSIHESASLGVAFVASVLGLGISFGLDFSHISPPPGPNLVKTISQLNINEIPVDIREECFSSSLDLERAKPGEWIAIWGASTTTGYITLQLSKLAGLKVICIADAARHGAKLLEAGADLLVDRRDPERAIEIIHGITGGKLRYAIDIVGKETATILQRALSTGSQAGAHAHLLGLTGLPKERVGSIRYHTVPIKLFHSSPAIGEGLVRWLEGLLERGALRLPEVVRGEGGLGGINAALETLKSGSVSGKRIVVDI
ncbi:oxidoreductase, zinc-binding dehydrogenase family [Aspergillus sclerotialis]|uniref:Oxidoreductase, zinc-binding dehydrogenase family n=1 Tax=Aspergillus sclerotialis TaxID=2070753 RepID=A0A3A2ZBB7_9EURO|nr:oxidoreductase, zinc-binding dehydrogenase family [Aspergillus sclerotialis]